MTNGGSRWDDDLRSHGEDHKRWAKEKGRDSLGPRLGGYPWRGASPGIQIDNIASAARRPRWNSWKLRHRSVTNRQGPIGVCDRKLKPLPSDAEGASLWVPEGVPTAVPVISERALERPSPDVLSGSAVAAAAATSLCPAMAKKSYVQLPRLNRSCTVRDRQSTTVPTLVAKRIRRQWPNQ